MTETYVTIHRCTDPLEAGVIRDGLEQRGIELRIIGTQNATSVGMPQMAIRLKLEVPAAQADEAREFVRELLDGDFALDEGALDAQPEDGDAPSE